VSILNPHPKASEKNKKVHKILAPNLIWFVKLEENPSTIQVLHNCGFCMRKRHKQQMPHHRTNCSRVGGFNLKNMCQNENLPRIGMKIKRCLKHTTEFNLQMQHNYIIQRFDLRMSQTISTLKCRFWTPTCRTLQSYLFGKKTPTFCPSYQKKTIGDVWCIDFRKNNDLQWIASSTGP